MEYAFLSVEFTVARFLLLNTHCVACAPPRLDGRAAKDHPYTPPEERISTPVHLRTAEEYAAAGGTLVSAADDAFRTHSADPDPVVTTFSDVLSAEDCEEIIRLAKPRMSRAGVTTDDGKGGRQSTGRTNDSTWLPHDSSPKVRWQPHMKWEKQKKRRGNQA
jgi:hypothetical protein